MNANGSGVKEPVDVITALRRAAKRPRTAQGWVHVGPALLEEAAYQLEAADQPTQPVLDLEGYGSLAQKWSDEADARDRLESLASWRTPSSMLRECATELRELLSDSKEKGTEG